MVSSKTDIRELLQEWRNACFFENQLTFAEAAESLKGQGPRLVDARPGTGSKASTWTIFDVNTNDEAVFVHAAVWDSNTNLETGNFVPPGEKASSVLSENRVQNVVGFKCDISYTLNTLEDPSLYDHLEVFEKYMLSLEDFNKSHRERSRWQDGSRRGTYILSSKLFVRKSMRPREPGFEAHEWLKRGLAAQKREDYALNPDRPSYFDLVNGAPVKLDKADPPRFQKGDLVWFAFKLSFFVSKESWSPDIMPIEFMRVVPVKEISYDGVSDRDGDDAEVDEEVAEEDTPKRLQEGCKLFKISRELFRESLDGSDCSSGKRKSVEQSDDDDTLEGDDGSVCDTNIEEPVKKVVKPRGKGKNGVAMADTSVKSEAQMPLFLPDKEEATIQPKKKIRKTKA
ncbi:hypothetical protein CVT26_011535 [Gymnopilus dilepis]|uniref:Uncharacterized protein n=1 Tax=Gymnopilus dilepis TaxID=231916 RepID=A0A409WSH7_9AGAR|nr:hypothetical protein CVT26_011535 [Gymnopilus dilepis]